jgi:predicted acylesterase/phospholipase RssA
LSLLFVLQLLNIMITARVCFASRLGVSFSPAGLLTPFHIGVANHLKEVKILNTETTLAGSSGGALAACTSALSIPSDILLESCSRIAQRCRDLGTFRTLRTALDEALFDILSLDAHDVINNRSGLTKIAYAEVFPRYYARCS